MMRHTESSGLVASALALALLTVACAAPQSDEISNTAELTTVAPTTRRAPTTTTVASTTTEAATESASRPVAAGTVTITESGCSFEHPDDGLSEGQLAFTVVNETAVKAGAHIWGPIADGYTFDDFAAYIDEEIRLTVTGEDYLGPQRWFGPLIPRDGAGFVDAGETRELVGTASAGIFGIVCAKTFEELGPRVFAYAGPFELSASPTLTLTDTECEYTGPLELTSSETTILLVNEIEAIFQMDLWLLDDGHVYEEFVAHIDEERRRGEAGEPPLGHPDFARLVLEGVAEPGDTVEMAVDLAPGTYGAACIRFDGDYAGIWAAGPLTVSR